MYQIYLFNIENYRFIIFFDSLQFYIMLIKWQAQIMKNVSQRSVHHTNYRLLLQNSCYAIGLINNYEYK